MRASRNYVVAAVLAGLLSLVTAVESLVLLPQGSAKLSSAHNQPPYAIVVISVVVGLIGVVAAYGVFRVQRWAVVLTLILMVINVLTSLPGIPFGPTLTDRISSVASTLVAGAAIYFLLRRSDRTPARAEAAGSDHAADLGA